MQWKHALLASSALLAATLTTTAAQAQTRAGSSAAATNTIEELVVTAEKREQSLQDVPVAVSAFTSEKRDLVGINSVQDMTNFTPGLQYSTQTDRISLRGVGRLNNSHAADSAVAVYADGIYSTSTVQAGETPIFIDRIEVLRGPQGTLYGRNSVGGAINIVSRRPTEDFYAEVRGTYANYNHTLLEAAVSGPITEGIQFRVAGNWEKQTKGWFNNVSTTGAPDEGGVIDTYFLEGQLSFKFNDRFDAWLKLSILGWDNGGGGPGSRSSWAPFPYNLAQQSQSNNIVPNAGFAYSGLATNVVTGCPAVNPAINHPRTICVDTPGTVRLKETFIFASHWTYHADKFDLKYITGGTRYEYNLTGDQDGTAVGSYSTCYTLSAAARASCIAGTTAPVNYPTKYAFDYTENLEWWSHELNLTSTGDGPFQYLFGAFLYNESYIQPVFTKLENESRFDGLVINAATGGLAPSDPLRHVYDDRPGLKTRSRAVFGQIDWQFAPTLKTTIGVRVGDDHKRGHESIRLVFAPGTLNATLPIDVTPVLGLVGGKGVVKVTTDSLGFKTRFYDDKFSAVTGTAGLEWTPTQDTMAYAKYSRGYKSGGFRIGIDTSLGADPETDKETLDSYEVGLKTTLLDGTLQINGDVFYYNYKNAQVPLAQPSATAGAAANSILFNVPKAVSQGVEFETIWQPIDRLQILANYSYLDAHIKEGLAIDPADSCAQAVGARRTKVTAVADAFCGGPQYLQDLHSYSLPNSAKNRVTLNANYTWDVGAGSLTASGTYIWRSAQFGSIFDRSYYKAPSFDQIDARLTWKAENGKTTVILFGKNLGNDLGYANGTTATRRAGTTPGVAGLTGVFGQNSTYELNPPRTYGVEVQFRY
jgi:iron complex outermembrane receptor protein